MSDAAPPLIENKAGRKRRSLSFWLLVGVLTLLAIPLLIFLVALSYLKSGGANERVLGEVKKVFGDKVSVGGTSSDWLNNLRISQLAVDGVDGKRALDVREVNVEWDPQQLLSANRIRQVHVIGPKATFARDANAKWNLELKPQPSSEGKFRIDQIRVSEGETSFEWEPGRAVHLQALSGHMTNTGPDAPQAFDLYGVFDSLNTLAVNGTVGPGAALTLRGDGGLDLQRDTGSLLSAWLPAGSKGHVQLALSARADALSVDTKRAGPVHLDGSLVFEQAHIALPDGLALKLNRDRIDLRGEIHEPTKPSEALALKDINLRITPALNFDGTILLPSEGGVRAENTTCEIDTAALLAYFDPPLLPPALNLRGPLRIEKAALNLPADATGPLSAQATVRGSDLRLALESYGDLPPFDIAGTLNWPAIEQTKLKMGNVGQFTFSLKDARLDSARIVQDLIEKAQIRDFYLDLAQLWESELGRRLLTGTPNPADAPPPAGQLPYNIKGTLQGAALTATAQKINPETQRIALSGLGMRDLAVLKWPFPFNVPARTFSGAAQLEFDLRKDGSVSAFAVASKLTASAAKNETPIELVLAQRFTTENGGMQTGPLRFQSVTIPFADLDQIFDVHKLSGVNSEGLVRFRDLEYDLTRGDVTGSFSIEKGASESPSLLPRRKPRFPRCVRWNTKPSPPFSKAIPSKNWRWPMSPSVAAPK